MSLVNGKYVVGKLPGYNSSIDTTQRILEKELLHNITFMDLTPVSYSLTFLQKLLNKTGTINNTKTLYTYEENNNIYLENFRTLLKKYVQIQNASSVTGLRLILSSDSVFNETFQIDTEDNDLIEDLTIDHKVINGLTSFNRKIRLTDPSASLKAYETKVFEGNNYADFLRAVLDAKVFGLNFALPKIPTNADYRSDISAFIKLTSPTGHIEAVAEYIIKPLLSLMIAASPISKDGLTYGFPFIWKINNYGNANINAAYISQMTVTRGSLETSYSDNFLPLSLDIRLVFSSLSDRFASILDNNNVAEELYNVGLYTPAQESYSLSGNAMPGGKSDIPDNLKLISINL